MTSAYHSFTVTSIMPSPISASLNCSTCPEATEGTNTWIQQQSSLLRQQWHTHWRIRATSVLYKPMCPFEHFMFAAHTMAASEASPVAWSEGCGDVKYRGRSESLEPGTLLEAMGHNPGLWCTQARQLNILLMSITALTNTLNPRFQPEISGKYIQDTFLFYCITFHDTRSVLFE